VYSQAANAFVMIWHRENNLKTTIRDNEQGFLLLGHVEAVFQQAKSYPQTELIKRELNRQYIKLIIHFK
jgi:hypothetical protein